MTEEDQTNYVIVENREQQDRLDSVNKLFERLEYYHELKIESKIFRKSGSRKTRRVIKIIKY